MQKRKKINVFETSMPYSISDNYNMITPKPYIDIDEISYNYTNKIDLIVQNLINKKNHIVYLKKIIKIKKNKKYILEINNLNVICKLWINDQYVGLFNNYSNRIEIHSNNGHIKIIMEVHNINKNIFLVYEEKVKYFNTCNLSFENTFNDIREYYIIVNKRKLVNANKEISYIICSDKNDLSTNYVKLCIKKYNNDKLQIVDSLIAKVNEPGILSFENYLNGEYFLSVEDDINRYQGSLINIFIGDDESIMAPIKKEITSMLNNVSNRLEYYVQYNKIIVKNISSFIKLYLLKRLYRFMTESDEQVMPIFYESIYDSFSQIYIVKKMIQVNIKRIVIFLTTSSSITYLYNYIDSCYNDELYIECYIRSSSFGNIIVENIILEILDVIKKKLKLNNVEIYLFGYSSCASAALMFISRYPNLIDGVISFGGEFNEKLILNTLNKKIWFIMGNEDDFYPRINKVLNNVMRTENSWKKIILKNINHATLVCEINRKNYLRTFLDYKVSKKKINKYYFDIPFYAYNNEFKVLKCENINYCWIKKNNNKLMTHGVCKIYRKNNQLVINKKILENKLDLKYYLFNGLGFYNIYTRKILYYIGREKNKQAIKNFIYPRNLSNSELFDIEVYSVELSDLIYKEEYNYILLLRYDEVNILDFETGFIFEKEYFKYKDTIFYGNYVIMNIIFYENKKNYILYIVYNDVLFLEGCYFINKFRINTDVKNRSIYSKNTTLIYTNKGYFYLDEDGDLYEFI